MPEEVEDLQERLQILETLMEVNRGLARELDLDRLLGLTVSEASRVMKADRSSLYVVDWDKNEVWTRVAQGVEEIRMPLGKGIAGRVAETGKTINVPNAYDVPEFDPAWDRKHGYVTRSMLCIPLRGRNGDVIGVFALLNKYDGQFTSNDEDLLAAIGAGVAVSLENALLVDKLRQTNQKLAETYDQLMQSEKLSVLGLLASTVAHDIQNPLAVVMGHAEILAQSFPQNSDVQRSTDAVIRQVDRVSDLVDSIRTYSRKDKDTLIQVDVHSVLEEALILTDRLLVTNGIEVNKEYSSDLPHALANAGRLEQVFMNLIQNAAQAMSDGGQLTLATRLVDRLSRSYIEIEVSDMGGGIHPEREEQIFKAFFTTKSEEEGTGLGLAICHRIIEAHNGSITLQNRPGEGATFLIRIPTDETQEK